MKGRLSDVKRVAHGDEGKLQRVAGGRGKCDEEVTKVAMRLRSDR